MDKAREIARSLVGKRLAGSVDIFPIESVAASSAGIEESDDAAIFVKTIDKNIQEAEDVIRELHPNKTPCIATFALHRLNREYKEWLVANTG